MNEDKAMTGYPSIDKPWLKYYSDEAINAPLPECSIYEYMYENNKDFPRDIALNYLGRKISYGKMFEYIDKTAAAFLAIGVKSNDIVTVALPSIPEALYCVYALNKIGAVANMIHPLAGKQEIINYLNEVESQVAVIFDGTYKILGDEINRTKVKYAVVVSAGDSLPVGIKQLYLIKNPVRLKGKAYRTWKYFLGERKEYSVQRVKKDCHEMAIISHTGGTTGEPKGVMLSDYNVNALIMQFGKSFDVSRQERALTTLPPFVNYSLAESMLTMLQVGFQVILIPDYKPEKFADYIKNYRPNHILSIPAYWEPVLRIKKIRNMDLSCLTNSIYGGEAMNSDVEEEISELLLSRGAKKELCKGIGMTELVAGATFSFPEHNEKDSVGIPMVRVGCKIVNPTSQKECDYEQEGEICFSGPTVMMGYYKNQEATDEIVKVHDDGIRWLHTGDLGYMDENGIIYVTGRIKRIIMTKGADEQVTKMFPDRIEKAIYQNNAVELCCVIGVPDEKRINYPKAFVIPKVGFAPSDALTASILDTCRKNLPEYMIPVEIEYRTELPRTSRGKIDYRKLEEREN